MGIEDEFTVSAFRAVGLGVIPSQFWPGAKARRWPQSHSRKTRHGQLRTGHPERAHRILSRISPPIRTYILTLSFPEPPQHPPWRYSSLHDRLGGSLAVASRGLFATGVSTDLSVTYLNSGGKIGDTVRAEVTCDKFGKTLAYTSIRFTNTQNELVARGSHTKFVALAWKD